MPSSAQQGFAPNSLNDAQVIVLTRHFTDTCKAAEQVIDLLHHHSRLWVAHFDMGNEEDYEMRYGLHYKMNDGKKVHGSRCEKPYSLFSRIVEHNTGIAPTKILRNRTGSKDAELITGFFKAAHTGSNIVVIAEPLEAGHISGLHHAYTTQVPRPKDLKKITI